MRKAQKQQAMDFLKTLALAQEELKRLIEQRKTAAACEILAECQQGAIALGSSIEQSEGGDAATVLLLEEYCELIYRIHEQTADGSAAHVNREYKNLRRLLTRIENSVRNDIRVRKEVVFFPYKASMWDSLESVYLAAKADPDCDVYCVPIPYYSLHTDRSFGQMHYEGQEFPDEAEVTDWQAYSLEERRPDVIYIHNPYDDCNLVTSVHPQYYSSNLKKYTDTLVYIPYYSTTGGMSEGQRSCPAYVYADYIVIQAPKYRDYFDERIPDQKFLPFGSPKFDRVIRKCKNPPEPPGDWKVKMGMQNGAVRKKVYFYNTSINGMLADTEEFLKKMEYVFKCFVGRSDACLLWRPHPLLESTFASMRPQFQPVYDALKRQFLENGIGIYDTTPDMTDSIALSDAYIGDADSSVASVFGIAGKPLFILNNHIHSEPGEDDWRGQINPGFNYFEQDRFAITQGNKLYVSQPFQYDYHYFCDLSDYAHGGYYSIVYEISGKLYVCPANAQDILVIGEHGVERKISLAKRIGDQGGAFSAAWKHGQYLLLLPLRYPAIVRYDTERDEVIYLEDHMDVNVGENERGEKIIGGSCIYKDLLYMASPMDHRMYILDIESGRSKVIELPVNSRCGYISIVEYAGDLWMLPYRGRTIVRWDPDSGEVREYSGLPRDFICMHPIFHYVCDEFPFAGGMIFYGDYMYLAPNWGNMYLKLHIETGEVSRWQPPYEEKPGKGYYFTTVKSAFASFPDKGKVRIYSWPGRKYYQVDLQTMAYEEIPVRFDVEELKAHEGGFCEDSQWLQYCCEENAFNSLKNFLDGAVTGKPFDRGRQLKAYGMVAANFDGTCGEKIHAYINKQ